MQEKEAPHFHGERSRLHGAPDPTWMMSASFCSPAVLVNSPAPVGAAGTDHRLQPQEPGASWTCAKLRLTLNPQGPPGEGACLLFPVCLQSISEGEQIRLRLPSHPPTPAQEGTEPGGAHSSVTLLFWKAD